MREDAAERGAGGAPPCAGARRGAGVEAGAGVDEQVDAGAVGWRWAIGGLAWLAGVALQLQQAQLWHAAVYAALALGGGLLGVGAWRLFGGRFSGRWFGPLVRVAGGAALAAPFIGVGLLGFSLTGLQASHRLAQQLPKAMEGVDLQLTGVVASLPRQSAHGLQFEFRVERATSPEGRPLEGVPTALWLGWYAGWGAHAELSAEQEALRVGQRWRFMARLKRPHGLSNPHGFDRERHLFEQGLRATGTVRSEALAVLLEKRAGHPVERLRQHVRDAIDATVPDRSAAGILAGLAIGDQSAIEREDWDLFRITGVAHLVAISGLHVTMFAWLAAALIRRLWRCSARAMLRLATPHAARWGGLAAALAYAVVSGWGVPAQRTVWMLAVVTLLQSGGKRWSWPLVLLAAAVVVTALDPWALLQPGFWLSFVAVGLLMASSAEQASWMRSTELPAAWLRTGRWLREAAVAGLRTQLIATVGLAPLALIFFQQLSLVGFLANLFAIPLITLLVTPLALLGILAPPLWTLAAELLAGFTAALQWMALWPAAIWPAAVAPWWAQVAGLLAAALAVLPLPLGLRLLALPLAIPLLWPPLALPAEGHFQVIAADVGQGTAVLVRTRHHLLVYDTGPQYSLDSDAGERVLLPLLRALGEPRIHRLVLSHRDSDHVGGAAALLGQWPVDGLLSSLEALHPLQWQAAARSVPSTRCEAGQSWRWDGVQFDMLHPQAEDHAQPLRSNALSCVLRVHVPGRSLLLTGDIERAGELALVARQGESLRSDVLLVPHHGSRTSSTEPFLDAVQPQLAVAQAGHRNRFGHPAADVLQRYAARGIAVVQSADCGAWRMSTDPDSEAHLGVCHRHATRRYWHHPGPD